MWRETYSGVIDFSSVFARMIEDWKYLILFLDNDYLPSILDLNKCPSIDILEAIMAI